MINVLLVEDHELYRMGLSMLLSKADDITLLAEAADGIEGIKKARELSPDVILMDIGLPNIDGIEATQRIKDFNPEIKVLMFTSRDSENDVFAAFQAGADGYVMKGATPEQTISAIKAVSEGIGWIDPAIAKMVFSNIQRPAVKINVSAPIQKSSNNSYGLTERELDVLEAMVEGLSNPEIADKLAAPDENGVLPDGMFDATIAEELDNLLETAAGYIEVEDEGIVTQVEADALVLNLNRTFDKLLASKAPYVVDVQGNWTIRVAGTENRLTRKNSASDNAGVYYYSALWSIDNVVSDANKTGADIADYRWDWTISKHNLSVVDETSGDTKEVEFYTIGNEQGYVTVDGYLREVGEITSYNYANYALEFVKAETTDSLVAIRRMSDRLYWGNGFSWKAPYDKVNTASTPQYVFVLDEQTTTTGIDNNEVTSSTAVKTEYYSISGMKVEAPVSGIFIKKVTFDDGRVETSKIYVR